MNDRELPSVTIEGEQWSAWIECESNCGMGGEEERLRMNEEHLAALLAALPDDQKARVVSELIDISPRFDEMIDEASDAEARKVFDMSDEEFDAEIRECGGDPERLNRWGAAMGRWITSLCAERAKSAALQRELKQETGARKRAEARVVELEARPGSLLREPARIDLSKVTPEQLARGAAVHRALREPCTVHNLDEHGFCIKCERRIRPHVPGGGEAK